MGGFDNVPRFLRRSFYLFLNLMAVQQTTVLHASVTVAIKLST